MGKTAFMFPGQGAQYVGMGKDFYEQIPVCKEMFKLAGEASGLDVEALRKMSRSTLRSIHRSPCWQRRLPC